VEAVAPKFDFEALWRAFVAIRLFDNNARLAPLYADPEKRVQLNAQARWEAEGFARLTTAELSRAFLVRSAWYDAVASLFEIYDFLVLPTTQVFPFDVDWAWPTEVAGRLMDSYHRWMEVSAPGTMSGCPVLNLPVGFRDGLPMGMQVIARPQADHGLLQFGALYETLHAFAAVHPPALAGA
jgi:amidase